MTDPPKKTFWSRLKPKSSSRSLRPVIRHIPNDSPPMRHFAAGEHWAAAASTSALPSGAGWASSTSLARTETRTSVRTITPTPTLVADRTPMPPPASVSYNDFGTWVGPNTARALRQRQPAPPSPFNTWAGESDESGQSALRPPPRRKPSPWTRARASTSTAPSPSPSPGHALAPAPSAAPFISNTLCRHPTLLASSSGRQSPPPFTGRASPASFTSDSTLRSPLGEGMHTNDSTISIAVSVETVSSVSDLSPGGSTEPLLNPACSSLTSASASTTSTTSTAPLPPPDRPAFRSLSPSPEPRGPTPPVPIRRPSVRLSQLPNSTRELIETCDRLLRCTDAYAADLHRSNTQRAEDQARFEEMASRLRDSWAAERAQLADVIEKVKARQEQQAEDAQGTAREMGGMIARLQEAHRRMQAENEALREENRRLRQREVGSLLQEAGAATGYL